MSTNLNKCSSVIGTSIVYLAIQAFFHRISNIHLKVLNLTFVYLGELLPIPTTVASATSIHASPPRNRPQSDGPPDIHNSRGELIRRKQAVR